MLGEDGINVGNPDGAVNDARNICSSIRNGTDPATLVLTVVRNSDLKQQLDADVIIQSVIYFCPDIDDGYFDQLQHFQD